MNKQFVTTLAAATSLLFHAHAATDFTDADGANSFISTAGNWDNGLPVGQLGTLALSAGYDSNADLVNYQILQTDGTLSRENGLGGLVLDGSSWEMDGATASFGTNVRGMTLENSASFTLTDGTYNQETNRDITLTNDSGSSITINGGTFNAGRSIKLNGTTSFTINAGTASTTGTFGQGGFIQGAGTMNMNGGALTGDRFVFQQSGTVANFGGTSSGSATFNDWGTGNGLGANGDRQDDRRIDINFLAGTLMSLTMQSTTRELDFDDDTVGDADAAWAEALWGTGQLKYTDGSTVVTGFDPDPETNGWTIVSWADASDNAVGFGTASSEYFDWTAAGSFGGTLALADTGGGGGDTTPPVWEGGYPLVNGETATGATARAAIDEMGTAYFVVVPDLAAAPSPAEVKAGTGSGGSGEVTNGTIGLPVATTEGTGAITGLSPGTAYDVWFVAEDDEGSPNLQGTPVKVDITTLTLYEEWADGGGAFGVDDNGDGIDNGMAWLLGASGPEASVLDKLPAVSVDGSGNLILTFSMRNAANRGSASMSTQHSSDLGATDPWDAANNESLVPEGPGTDIPVGVVSFDVTANGDVNDVMATIPAGEGNGSGKLFGRLSASE